MIRYISFLIFIFINLSNITSQDLLVKSNGDTIVISVIEISDYHLIYKKENEGEKVFTTHFNKLKKIIYSTGEVLDFNKNDSSESEDGDEYYNKLTNGNGFFGPSIRSKGKKLKSNEVISLYREIEDYKAEKLYKNGRFYNGFGNIIAFPSGYILGGQLYKALSSEQKTDPTLLIVGAFGSILSISMNVSGVNKIIRSVNSYNESIYIDVGQTENGFGMQMSF